jgi:hypothetical protein
MISNDNNNIAPTPAESEALRQLGAHWVPSAVDPVAFALELESRRRHRRLRVASVAAIAAAAATALLVFGSSLLERPAPAVQFDAAVPSDARAASPLVPAAEPGIELGVRRRDPWVERAVGDPTDPRDLPAEYGALGAFYLAVE